jgi:hypothetical protein
LHSNVPWIEKLFNNIMKTACLNDLVLNFRTSDCLTGAESQLDKLAPITINSQTWVNVAPQTRTENEQSSAPHGASLAHTCVRDVANTTEFNHHPGIRLAAAASVATTLIYISSLTAPHHVCGIGCNHSVHSREAARLINSADGERERVGSRVSLIDWWKNCSFAPICQPKRWSLWRNDWICLLSKSSQPSIDELDGELAWKLS